MKSISNASTNSLKSSSSPIIVQLFQNNDLLGYSRTDFDPCFKLYVYETN